jgi:N-acyl-D-aspartate/D-glutamate deacylase
VLQVVSDFADVDAEFAIFRSMAEASGRPLSVSLVQVRGNGWRRQLELLAAANADGVAMTAQVAPRAVGLMLGLQCTLHPLLTNSVYAEVAALPLAERVAVMADAHFKQRIIDAAAAPRDDSKIGGLLIHAFHRMYELEDPPDYEPARESSIAARAEREGRAALDLAYDVLLRDGGRSFLYLPSLNYADNNLDAVGEMLAHPNSVVGLGDGGAHVGTICDASFPTTMLTLWARDRVRGRLDLPFAIQRQTRDTARAVGLLDRGVLAPGYRADINVIDFERLTARRPEIVHDLPAGGKRLVQTADGYVATIVAGAVTYENGRASGPLPGRLVRGPQAAPTNGAHR